MYRSIINRKILLMLCCLFLFASCSSIRELRNELRGTAAPPGGISESILPTKSFSASNKKIWSSSQEILDEWGYVYDINKSNNTIKTEPRYITDTKRFGIIGSNYQAKLYITIEKSSVTFRARFNKESNIVQGTQDVVYPEKENELRRKFFDAMTNKLGNDKQITNVKNKSSNKIDARSTSHESTTGKSKSILPTKSFSASNKKIWSSSQEILDEWGYVYDINKSNNTIKTEPRYITDTKRFGIIGSNYQAKLYITIEKSSVTFRARFNKQSNIVQSTQNVVYPEKESELRKKFFDALTKKLGDKKQVTDRRDKSFNNIDSSSKSLESISEKSKPTKEEKKPLLW